VGRVWRSGSAAEGPPARGPALCLLGVAAGRHRERSLVVNPIFIVAFDVYLLSPPVGGRVDHEVARARCARRAPESAKITAGLPRPGLGARDLLALSALLAYS